MATAWGQLDISFGTPGALDVMSATLASIGTVKEDSITIETADGQIFELWGTGHNLVDKMKGEPIITVKCKVINMSAANRAIFWSTTTSGLGPTLKIAVASFVNSSKYSVKIASLVLGSETFEAPYCSVDVKPALLEKEGWTADVEFTVLKGQSGKFFSFGVV